MARRWLPVLLLLLAAAAAQAADPDPDPKPIRETTCFDCHFNVSQGDSPPLATFVNLVPPATAGGLPGTPFTYQVGAQNAWTSDLPAVRVTLDLTAAPSIGLAADVPPLAAAIDDAIPVDPSRASEPQRRAVTVAVPEGETQMTVRLEPTGEGRFTDLALLVYPPGRPLDGAPEALVDANTTGGAEVYALRERADFNRLGYGDWTFVAQASLLPRSGGGGLALPASDGTIPFSLRVDASAASSADRVASLTSRELVKEGGSTTVTFRLVALGVPGPDEQVTLWSDAWAHYVHKTQGTDNDENATMPAVTVPVRAEQGQAVLRTDGGTVAFVPVPHNGPTLATVSEAVGYATAFLLVASVVTGGMFGKASRRGLNAAFGAAKRRVAFHNFLSYGILLAATAHAVLFIVEAAYDWTLGLIWGGAAVLALLGLGVTGAVQVPLIRAWGYGGWRWTHYGLAVAAILLAVVHGALDGIHYSEVQRAVGWKDPFA